MGYIGQCHCGAVRFSVAGDPPSRAVSCNCSHCRAKGLLLTFIPSDLIEITSGETELQSYRFNKHIIAHEFCRQCGCQPFGNGLAPDGSSMTAVNLRCVPEADVDGLILDKVDGASH